MSDSAPAPKVRYSPFLVFVIYADIALYGFVFSMRGVLLPLVKNSFGADYFRQGVMTGAISFAGVLFCIVSGVFMSRFGLKKTILTGFAVTGLGMAAIYTASGFWMATALFLWLQGGLGFFEIGINGSGVRIFTVRSALMINLLHFAFGIGAIIGPRYAGFIVDTLDLRWQLVYPLALVPVVIMLIVTLFARFPPVVQENRISMLAALKEPDVWLFGLIMGFICSIEAWSVSWSGLYLQDVFGLDIATTGAVFLSFFYFFYTASRLAGGIFMEKIGYLRVLIFCAAAIILLLSASFVIGRPGMFLIPVNGLFISLIYPTMLALSVPAFKEKAQAYSPAIICVAFVLNGLVQAGFGLSNRLAGPAAAYRSCLVYAVILTVLLLILRKRMKRHA